MAKLMLPAKALDKTVSSAAHALGSSMRGYGGEAAVPATRPMLPLKTLSRIASPAAQASAEAILNNQQNSGTPKLMLPSAAFGFSRNALTAKPSLEEPATPRERRTTIKFAEYVEYISFDSDDSSIKLDSCLVPVKFATDSLLESALAAAYQTPHVGGSFDFFPDHSSSADEPSSPDTGEEVKTPKAKCSLSLVGDEPKTPSAKGSLSLFPDEPVTPKAKTSLSFLAEPDTPSAKTSFSLPIEEPVTPRAKDSQAFGMDMDQGTPCARSAASFFSAECMSEIEAM